MNISVTTQDMRKKVGSPKAMKTVKPGLQLMHLIPTSPLQTRSLLRIRGGSWSPPFIINEETGTERKVVVQVNQWVLSWVLELWILSLTLGLSQAGHFPLTASDNFQLPKPLPYCLGLSQETRCTSSERKHRSKAEMLGILSLKRIQEIDFSWSGCVGTKAESCLLCIYQWRMMSE